MKISWVCEIPREKNQTLWRFHECVKFLEKANKIYEVSPTARFKPNFFLSSFLILHVELPGNFSTFLFDIWLWKVRENTVSTEYKSNQKMITCIPHIKTNDNHAFHFLSVKKRPQPEKKKKRRISFPPTCSPPHCGTISLRERVRARENRQQREKNIMQTDCRRQVFIQRLPCRNHSSFTETPMPHYWNPISSFFFPNIL